MNIHAKLLSLVCFLFLYTNSTAQTSRKIILEDITGAWCGLCPEGFATLGQINNNFLGVIPVGIHIADPMETPETAMLGDIYTGSGVNAFLLDRYLFPDLQFVPFTFEYLPLSEKITERLATPASVAIALQNISYDTLSRTLHATVKAHFTDSVANYNNLRFNLWLLEDSVVSSASGYAQVNFFDAVPGYFYSGAGNPMYNFPHRHVLRAALGGAWGTENSLPQIPSQIAINDSFTYTYTYALPQAWNLDKVSLVGMVQNYDSLNYHLNEILNAENISLTDALTAPLLPNDTTIVIVTDTTVVDTTTIIIDTTATNIGQLMQPQLVKVFPNPASDVLKISYHLPQTGKFSLAIYDLTGKQLHLLQQETKVAGNYAFLWQDVPLASGFYLVGLELNGRKVYNKLFVTKLNNN